MSENKKKYQNVVEMIQEQILKGQLESGEFLASERKMAEQLNISRTSVREALKVLEVIGLVETRTGGGTYVKTSFDQMLLNPLSIMFSLKGGIQKDIFKLRRALEQDCIPYVTRTINDEQKEELKKLYDTLVNSTTTNEREKADLDFHFYLIKCSNNVLTYDIYLAVSNLISDFVKNARGEITQKVVGEDELVKLHTNIYEAIIAGNETMALEAIKEHYAYIMKTFINS